MFNRGFFDRDFNKLIESYSLEKKSETPVVVLHLRDGSHYYVESIELVGEAWISFRISPDPNRSVSEVGKSPDQITCPYGVITRIDFLPRMAESKVGFRITK